MRSLVSSALLARAGLLHAPAGLAADATASAPLPTHRPLRENQPAATPEPTEPATFAGAAGAPPFDVVPRKGQLARFPCSQCHQLLPLIATPRKLVNAPHPAALNHGGRRIWCLDCHTGNDRDVLRSLGGARIDLDRSDLLCGQCHGARHRDWFFGAHGKRAATVSATRQIYACAHCHDPHRPQLQARTPSKPAPRGAAARCTTRSARSSRTTTSA